MFLQIDPVGPKKTDTNLYVYVKNNPVNLMDPYGLAWFDNNCGRDIPVKPETDCGGYEEDKKYNCPSGVTCDVDAVYPPNGGNPIKICVGCTASCSGGQIVIECHTAEGWICQGGWGGPVPSDWWDDGDHSNWPLPGDPVNPAP